MGKKKEDARVDEIRKWFRNSVTYEGEAYEMDREQIAAVMDESMNTIIVARAGSGKTRTIVAKIVYLIMKCNVRPDEIMAFVFNANAAKEINERLSKMRVDGVLVMDECGKGISKVKIATTFHAFARRIVYEVCGGKKKCGKILAGEKEEFIEKIVRKIMNEDAKEEEISRMTGLMVQFVNRAQQKYLGGKTTLSVAASRYLDKQDVSLREKEFIEMGVKCFKRYHWYLLNGQRKLPGFEEYGTDFNLIVSWASKMVLRKEGKVKEWLGGKRWILIDEYQDFSQLFLASVEAIRSVATDARLFVVGDDLQAINRFAGSEVEFFNEFEKYFCDDAKRLEITTNYRCDKMVIDVARKFMAKAMREKGSFRAKSRKKGQVVIMDPREIECEHILVDYDKRVSGRDLVYNEAAYRMTGRAPKYTTVRYIKALIKIIRSNWKYKDVLILHRNNETNMEGVSLTKLSDGLRWGLEKLGVATAEEYDKKVKIMTMHKSKGLEAEVVIIMEADEGVIPKFHSDTRLFGLFGETDEVALDDQKRLFYVAMTRAKKRLYIMHDDSLGDGFIKYLGKGLIRWEE